MKSKLHIGMVVLLMALFSVNSFGAAGNVKINKITADYMPDRIRFTVDQPIGDCVAGKWLDRYGKGSDTETKRENNRIVYSSLLTAITAGKTVVLYLTDSCGVDALHFTGN